MPEWKRRRYGVQMRTIGPELIHIRKRITVKRRRELTRFARRMRKAPTPGEEIMWKLLKAHFPGGNFRRQRQLFGYIADFYCPRLRLVIEVDGPYHATPEAARHDAMRDAHLQERGIWTYRIRDDLVRDSPDLVVDLLLRQVQHRSKVVGRGLRVWVRQRSNVPTVADVATVGKAA
ncbi:MAG TPA: endonuclease domain-containing protein [Thermoplasmata archaeon]|nr:endonuclease domain-containing protein [Thermoplasmata archaeon]